MKPSKQDIQIWVDALRSGQYKQTKNSLQDSYGYCCLGVACKLFIKNIDISLNEEFFMKGGLPVGQLHAPKWLKDLPGDFNKITKNSLVKLNDNEDFSFDEIADVLEAVYILEVLE